MALELAYRFPGLISASVSSAGASHFESRSDLDSGVHILQVQGTDDTSILFEGGSIGGRLYPGAEATTPMGYLQNCSLTGLASEPKDLESPLVGQETKVIVYSSGCISGGSVELWAIQKGGHGLGRPVPDASRLELLDWLYKKAKKGWPKDFNGVAPPPALDLGLNNVGVYNGLDELLYSCLRLTSEEELSFEGVEQFDVAFSISNPSTGKIKLENFREFNARKSLIIIKRLTVAVIMKLVQVPILTLYR